MVTSKCIFLNRIYYCAFCVNTTLYITLNITFITVISPAKINREQHIALPYPI